MSSPGGRWRCIGRGVVMCAALAMAGGAHAESATEVVLTNDVWTITIDPATLALSGKPADGAALVISAALPDLGPVRNLERSGNKLHWELPQRNITLDVTLQQRDLLVNIRAAAAGSFTWPTLGLSAPAEALVWPYWEGRYVPLDDQRWIDFLIEHSPWSTLDGLCMPFWGIACGKHTLTFIATNRYNNAIRFSHTGGDLAARFTHEFPPSKSEWAYGFVIRLSDGTSPIEPARQFRRWLSAQGKLVTMARKMKAVPKAERLLGAAHVYLWGDTLLTRHDVERKSWQMLCKTLIKQSQGAEPSPGRHIKQLMQPPHWQQVEEIATLEWPYDQIKTEVTNELSRLLQRTDFHDQAAWSGVTIPAEAAALLARGLERLPLPELCRLNCLLLRAAYAEFMLPVDDWGDGVSVKMLRQLHEAGFDRMRFCVGDWAGIELRPAVARTADKLGYLFGTYDSFHSIHDPKLRGTDATWTTAQFDRALWETGLIIGRDGQKLRGFKGRGGKLSPRAARPYVEKRVNQNLANVPYNYYFVDCDAYGEVYDDYSPLHPATQHDDALARNARLAWIRDTHTLVIGSEGGSSYAAPVVHVVEGMLGPGFGWGDPDLRDRKSPYFVGGYYPPDGPKVFVQPAKLKEEYRYLYYDPRFRLPLNEVVFHDSFVSTHQWGSGSLKYPEVANTVALFEVLYQCPPLYHMNIDEFRKHRTRMKSHYDFFSPIHRAVGFTPLTDFAWLTADRLVQRTIFGDKIEITANFGPAPFDNSGQSIPAGTAVARWRATGQTRSYTPK